MTRAKLYCCMVLVAVAAGCRDQLATYPVEGTVSAHDGAPLAGVQLVWQCEDPPLSAMAITDEHGHYRLGTLELDDGAPVGDYRITLTEPRGADPDADVVLRIDSAYSSFATTPLRYAVKATSNRFDIQLPPPARSPN